MSDKPVTLSEAIRLAREAGINDPMVTCHDHGGSVRLSKMSPIARLALEDGIDTVDRCLLLDGQARK